MDKLMAIVTFILAMSVASERLVEIIKGFIPSLDKQITDNSEAEGRRRSFLQILAVLSGVLTAFWARDYVPQELADPTKGWSILGLGLLASGGSGFWNSVLSYATKVKEIKFDRPLDTYRTHPEGPANLSLRGAAVDVELAGDHAKGPLIIDIMHENRQVAIKIGERVALPHKAKISVYQRHTLGENRQLKLWHAVTSCVWVGSNKIRDFGTVSRSSHPDKPKDTSTDGAVFAS